MDRHQLDILAIKEKAMNKVKCEIDKDITTLVEMVKSCGYGELLYYLHYLHAIRLIKKSGNVPDHEQEITSVYVGKITDVYKYIIQLLIKYCKNGFLKHGLNNLYINKNLVYAMTECALSIYSKYEFLSFLTLVNDIELHGERNQKIKINFEKFVKDERLSKFINYAVRVSRNNDFKKDNLLEKKDFLEYFKKEYNPHSDLFQLEFQVSIDTFTNLVDWILQTIVVQIEKNKAHFAYLPNGNVDLQAYDTIMHFGQALLINKNRLYSKFGTNIQTVIDKLTFKSTYFDERQLRYDLIARQPIIDIDSYFIVSPEILLDSLIVNSHYSLLEAKQIEEEYKKRYAAFFIDRISKEANVYGFTEVTRNLELYEGKKQIGDVDLVLKNSSSHYLLIEAKNHALPLDVYFHNFEATEERLNKLTNDWENKVDKRCQHLKHNYMKYGISSSFTYIIVSKQPEIISHFSQYLIVSIEEFIRWLSEKDLLLDFKKLSDKIYNFNKSLFTKEQIAMMQKDIMSGWSFF